MEGGSADAPVTPEELAHAVKCFEEGSAMMRSAEEKVDYDKVIELLCTALQTMVRQYGDMGLQVAPVFYMYGAALLCKAQEENEVFGGGAADASAARDRRAAGEAAPACAPGDKGKGKAAAAPPAPASDESGSDEEGEDGSSGDEEGDGAAGEAGDDASDMQLAWENLEYARLIYAATGTPSGAACAAEHSEALAQVHAKLGMVSLEEEQFEAALVDFDAALALFRTLTPTPHRRVAGLLYEAALALQQLGRPADALQRFGDAIAACQQRLTELRTAAQADGTEPEVAEIAATIAEMRAREEELRESVADEARTKDALKQAFATMAGAASGGGAGFDAPRLGGGAAAPATNLGVVGRGVTRITPAAAGGASGAAAPVTAVRRVTPQGAAPSAAASAVAPAAPPAEAAPQPPKRTLEDAIASGGADAKAAKPAEADGAAECKQQ